VDPFNKAVEAERTGETVEAKVKSLNKGGLVVLFGELKGALTSPPPRHGGWVVFHTSSDNNNNYINRTGNSSCMFY